MAIKSAAVLANYDALASEYYDAKRHPTCANFREASRTILKSWIKAKETDVYCEVGAGRSLLAEILASHLTRLDRLTLIDDSPAMLAYSNEWLGLGIHLIHADISKRIPLERESVDVLVSSLGDPYNVDGCWAEIQRVIRPGGRVFYTTPSYGWAHAYRGPEQCGSDAAEFVLANGERICVPSHIYPAADQTEFVKRYGLVVDDIASVPVSALSGAHISPKLSALVGTDGGVVTGYALRRIANRGDSFTTCHRAGDGGCSTSDETCELIGF